LLTGSPWTAQCVPQADPHVSQPEDFAIFAGILPEGKFNLVKAFQKDGHTVGIDQRRNRENVDVLILLSVAN
jgi:hypothetical protein